MSFSSALNRCVFLLCFIVPINPLLALNYSMCDDIKIEEHKNPLNDSSQFLDTLVENGLGGICMVLSQDTNRCSWMKYFVQPTQGGGTGFFITPSGHILTNKHITQSQSNFDIFSLSAGCFTTASLIAEHPTADIALVKIDNPADITFSHLKITEDDEKEEVGNWVLALRGRVIINGSTLLILPSIGKLLHYIRDNAYAVSTIAVTQVNSGSPVLNFQERVIGIMSEYAGLYGLKDTGMSSMLSLHKLKDWIEDALCANGYSGPHPLN